MAKTIKVAGSSAKAKKTKKPKITSVTIRENRNKDFSPKWDGHETWDTHQFMTTWHAAMKYYNIDFSTKDLKPAVLSWMAVKEYPIETIAAYRKTSDWRTNSTMGGVASCLLKGMPEQRDDFNNGRNTAEWLDSSIRTAIDAEPPVEESAEKTDTKTTPAVNIQERVKEATLPMTEEIEEAIDKWISSPETFDPKQIKILSLLKGKGVKAAHARIIKDSYTPCLMELEELASGDADEQLKEGYRLKTKKQIRELIVFYKEISDACNMLMEEAKVQRKPRAKKVVPKDKVVEKLKYLKTHEPLKLVSINPVDIIGSNELWIYNTKTRKIGKYISDEMTGPLGIKGTTIIGYDEHKSIQKTIRKPDEKLKEFKNAGKIALRKFLDDINTTDTKLNGRINEDIILLKVAS